MSKYSHLIPVIFVSVFFFSLLSAQEQVQETLLLVAVNPYGEGEKGDPLGSDLFAYSRYGNNLFRLEEEREVPVLKERFGVGIGEFIRDVQISRDNSRIVFSSSGATWHFDTAIHSVSPDGSQLRTLVKSGDDCGEFVWPGYGSGLCSFPLAPRLSPDGQRIRFINEISEWDEAIKSNRHHFYLSMIPVTGGGGQIVRLEEVGNVHVAVWSEDGTSVYYYSSKVPDQTWNLVPRRYDLESGRSTLLTDASWHVWPPGLAVSRSNNLYFVAKQGFARLDPETGVTEVISEERFDSFALSPDGRRAVGVKGGDLTLINLEFLSSSPLQVNPGAMDALELGQIPAARERWIASKLRPDA